MRDERDRIDAIVQLDADRWLAFADPVRVVAAYSPADVRAALGEVERLTRDAGLYAVGFVSYEAAEAFALRVQPPPDGEALVWFALFEPGSVRSTGRPVTDSEYRLGGVTPALGRAMFDEAFGRIKTLVGNGDTYQVNFTFKMTATFEGDPRALFGDLVDAQGGAYSVYLATGGRTICSASPELFFALDGLDVQTRPMKGTARRGRTTAEDIQCRDGLHQSLKERAENVMIVDMMRNDLGRIAQVGSVAVPELFTIERYPTLWQMTSLVTARSTASLPDVFAALHPPASVTGAPKVRTMEIVSDLEHHPRGIYTGAIGYVRPDGAARFSVAIRTAVVDLASNMVEFGVGSGIVWDSDPTAEYEECRLKGSVLGRRHQRFELLETMRWTPDEGFFLFDRHLERLKDSAEYFGIVCRLPDVRAALAGAVGGGAAGLRVRLLLARDGSVRVESTPLDTVPAMLSVRLASRPIDPGAVWLFHKTTNRRVYEQAREDVEADEVLLWNPDRQVTEATTANIVVERRGERVTPPIACGLLGGTLRAELLARHEIREAIVTIDDLASCDALWLINSVQEWRPAVMMKESSMGSGAAE